MTIRPDFIDYYEILQVDPACDARSLEAAYRHFAKMYHPDHVETADVTRFNDVIQAYRALRSPEDRAKYDIHYATITGFDFSVTGDESVDEKDAVSDADMHEKFLLFLYKRRREHAMDAGVGRYFVQDMLQCGDDHFDFHVWYLKSKGFIETTEQGTLAITIEGVDHVISMSRTNIKEKLRIAQSSDPTDSRGP